jgi:hypothetical protein
MLDLDPDSAVFPDLDLYLVYPDAQYLFYCIFILPDPCFLCRIPAPEQGSDRPRELPCIDMIMYKRVGDRIRNWILPFPIKVPKREIFDRSDFPDFYTIKSLRVGDFRVKIEKILTNK